VARMKLHVWSYRGVECTLGPHCRPVNALGCDTPTGSLKCDSR
jgi:hypothetical protein